jgi:DNA-binding NtrC family response regulator
MNDRKRVYRILVVDDDPNMINLTKFYLKNENFEISSCFNGHEALTVLENQSFDLILIDILMPRMDGQTLLGKMIKDLKIESPIIVVTAHGPTDNLMQLVDEGAYDILQKPFTSNRLKLTLNNALKFKDLLEKHKKIEESLKRE